MGNKGSKKSKEPEVKASSEKELKDVVNAAFSELVKADGVDGKLRSFVPALLANNQVKGGLEPALFHLICKQNLSKEKLLGLEPVTADEFVNFYIQIGNEKKALKNKDNLKVAVDKALELQKKGKDLDERVKAVSSFFERADKDKSGTIDKSELEGFYSKVLAGEYNLTEEEVKSWGTLQEDSKTAFKWIDRNSDGKLTLWELLSYSLSAPLVARSRDEWGQYLDALGFHISFE